MEFLKEFKGYEEPYPVGLQMPTIQITKEEYEKYGLKDGASNSEF